MMYYKNFSQWLRQQYGTRVQKISINIPFSCPNRDGKKGFGGCIYCNNTSFLPEYTLQHKSVSEQISEGINYFSKKYPAQLYIAYFQNYTNTYESPKVLYKLYSEACEHEKVVALAIATRPDCINDDIIEVLVEINKRKKIIVEIGIESTLDSTLSLLNRCHSFNDVKNAVSILQKNKFWITGHLILGLPTENEETIIEHAKKISDLKIQCIKLHQLQILKDTILHNLFEKKLLDIKPLSLDEYIRLSILFLEHLSPDIYVERFTSESPKEQVIAPNWNQIKNYQVVELIRKKMKEQNTFQGKYFK